MNVRPAGVRARWLLALSAAAVIVAAPTTAHADAAGPSDWRSEIAGIEPDDGVVTATIEGGDAFVRIEVLTGHDVVVSGYAGEPYLWIDGAGAVHENRHSPATYYNQSRDGIAELPDEADPSAAPDWVVVGDGGAWAWHDHRAHYMGARPPQDMSPGDSLPASIIPLTVDGTPVEITVITTLVSSPSAWPAVIGGLAGLALVVLAGLPDRRLPLAAVVVVVGAAASAVGIAQYLSLPAETGPRPIWWIPPVVATACGIALVLLRSRSPFLRTALVLVAGSQLIVWGGMRRFGLVRGVLPTSAPYWLDRAVTAAALVTGIGVCVVAIVDLVRFVGHDSTARSMASSSSP